MMETHKMLKEIADKIGYKIRTDKFHLPYYYNMEKKEFEFALEYNGQYGKEYLYQKLDEREIIFTDKFILKLGIYQLNNEILTNGCDILNHLENPTLYLYNLIKNDGNN